MNTIRLNDIATRAPKGYDKDTIRQRLLALREKLSYLQNLLYAERKHSILVVIQGMDASGKDGLIRDVFTSMNPQGVTVKSYKVPTEEEDAHDFLWRIHAHAPAKGMIQVFNRSHYESVLVTRVHGMIDDATALKRMQAINDFERLLTQHNDTHILKCYLHVSAERQNQRLHERIQQPEKMWKYNENDFAEAKLRNKYIAAYEEAFNTCGEVPWHIIPADQNWYKSYLVADLLYKLMDGLQMKFPGMKQEE